MLKNIEIDGYCSLSDFGQIVEGHAHVSFGEAVRTKVDNAHEILQRAISQERYIYGINTGFGALAGHVTPQNQIPLLQKNLIYHLATGVGEPLSWEHARSLMLARLIVLSKGHSGCAFSLLELIAKLLNTGLAPFVPSKGTVGASGDLTPSSHLALALMGEGSFFDRSGNRYNKGEAFGSLSLSPLILSDREGLAIVNGTSAMTGIATINSLQTERLVKWALHGCAAYADIMAVRTEAWSDALSDVRPHPGQQSAQRTLSELLSDSKRAVRGAIADKRAPADPENAGEHTWPQDPYTLRCMPQIFGAILDAIEYHDRTVEIELNSVTDNPLVINEPPYIVHGGNFYGQHVGFASDALVNAMVKLGVLLERQIARITDQVFNKGLPAFLQSNNAGLNSGFMGAQVTASALLAEMRTHALPASIQSVPTNANNQDVNTMGTIAARQAYSVLQDLSRILAIHGLCVAQAVDIIERDAEELAVATTSQTMRDTVREHSPFLSDDRPLSDEIGVLSEVFLGTSL